MILQALKEYYDRKAAEDGSDIAPLGWERKELPFLIVLDRTGKPVGIEDTREQVGKKLRAKTFLVPHSVKRSVGIAANLLWDNVEYVTGVVCKGKAPRVKESHAAFIARLAPYRGLASLHPLVLFLANPDVELSLSVFPPWTEMKDTCAFVSFKIAGADEPVFRDPAVIQQVEKELAVSAGADKQLCLVTGELDVPAELHPAIKGVQGANTTGGNIVAFNFDAANSYGKEKGFNAPVGERAVFAYTTALNTLLGKDSRQKMQVGDATMVFWAAKADPFEQAFANFWREPEKDNPDQGVNAIAALYSSPQTGAAPFESDQTRFYVLGLAPNAARISVRFWQTGTVAELAGRFRLYFEDLAICHGSFDKDHLSLWRLMLSLAPLGKTENIPPTLAGGMMRSILDGLPFSEALFQTAIRRTNVEHEVTYARAKLIKGCLNRKLRFISKVPNERSLTVSLDKENTDAGYRLGRLFAVLEKIQQEANPGVNATIRDKFYASASAMPSAVFGNLMRLKNHHLSKLENPGRRVNFERLLGEVIGGMPPAFPAHLNLDGQGKFAIGYYQQMQDFFTKKADKENA